MNWKLVFLLSLFGLAMAFATVFAIPGNIELLVWLPIFVVCAVIIAKRAPGKFFLHGFFVSLVNSVWVTSAHELFFDDYIARHAQEAEMTKGVPLAPRLLMVIMGPLIGVVFGLVIGVLSIIATKIFKKPAPVAPAAA